MAIVIPGFTLFLKQSHQCSGIRLDYPSDKVSANGNLKSDIDVFGTAGYEMYPTCSTPGFRSQTWNDEVAGIDQLVCDAMVSLGFKPAHAMPHCPSHLNFKLEETCVIAFKSLQFLVLRVHKVSLFRSPLSCEGSRLCTTGSAS